MKVKNLIVNDKFVDDLEKEMCQNNMQYLIIKTDDYYELHCKENIYRMYIFEKRNMIFHLVEEYKITKNNYKRKIKNKSEYKILKKSDYKKSN